MPEAGLKLSLGFAEDLKRGIVNHEAPNQGELLGGGFSVLKGLGWPALESGAINLEVFAGFMFASHSGHNNSREIPLPQAKQKRGPGGGYP